jgi:hypothetical protein
MSVIGHRCTMMPRSDWMLTGLSDLAGLCPFLAHDSRCAPLADTSVGGGKLLRPRPAAFLEVMDNTERDNWPACCPIHHDQHLLSARFWTGLGARAGGPRAGLS